MLINGVCEASDTATTLGIEAPQVGGLDIGLCKFFPPLSMMNDIGYMVQ